MLIEGASEIVSKPDEGIHPSFPPCGICPFSEGRYHADGMLSLLLGKLESDTLSSKGHNDSELSGSLSVREPLSGGDGVELILRCGALDPLVVASGQTSCSLNYGTSVVPDPEFLNILCHCYDAFSLLEIFSSIVVWEWTSDKILPRLFKLLEFDDLGSFSCSAVLLLGQLARCRIEASGCRDGDVEDIAQHLSSFMCQIATRNCHPSLVAATEFALSGLSSSTCEGSHCKENGS